MRRPVRFEPALERVTEPVTKLAGRPVWLEQSQWPRSAANGTPMYLIGQFRIDGPDDPGPVLAYVFMSSDEDGIVEDTWDPDAGENAVIIQPGGRVPGFVSLGPVPPELPDERDDLLPHDDAPDEPYEFLGGEPNWIQDDERPAAGWRLIAQLSDSYGDNFGDAGIGYVFVSPDGKEGRFLWQCA